jgi:chemotaxis family two-component system response regulator Rcp1
MGAPVSSNPQNTLHILLVEDSAADVRLTREALDESGHPYTLTVAVDGVRALEYLRTVKPRPDDRPDIILLDWNLPRMDGQEVLREIKADPDLRMIPVVVLTTSRAQDDIARAYELQANCFISKPVDVLQFFRVINEVENFWTSTATLPK